MTVLDQTAATAPATDPPVAPKRAGLVPGRGKTRWVLFAAVFIYLTLPPLAALFYSLSARQYDGLFPTDWTGEHWTGIFSDERLLAAIRRSLIIAVSTVALVTLLVLPPLYWAYVRNPALRSMLLMLALLPFCLPFVVMAFGIDRVAEFVPILNAYTGTGFMVLIGHVSLCFAFYLWPVDAAMAAAGVKRLHEAAQASGAGPVTTLVRCILPNILPGIISGSILVFAISWGEYSIAKIMTRSQYEIVPVWQVNLTPVNGTSDPRGVAVMAFFTFLLFLTVSLVAAIKGTTRVSFTETHAAPAADES